MLRLADEPVGDGITSRWLFHDHHEVITTEEYGGRVSICERRKGAQSPLARLSRRDLATLVDALEANRPRSYRLHGSSGEWLRLTVGIAPGARLAVDGKPGDICLPTEIWPVLIRDWRLLAQGVALADIPGLARQSAGPATTLVEAISRPRMGGQDWLLEA